MKINQIQFSIILTIICLQVFSQSSEKTKNKNKLLTNDATLTGHVYRDTNGNGTQNIGEPNLANVGVLISQSDGSFQVVDTNISGNWTALVSSGNTTVSLDQTDLPSTIGRIQTEGTDPNSVIAISNQTVNAGTDGFFYVGKITGHLYYDKNGNGTQNALVDQNMANVDVVVTDAHGNIYNLVTDSNGNWAVTAGIGQATVAINTNDSNFPLGATQTEGTNPNTSTVLIATTTFTENDGYFESGTVTGHIYFDSNGNGTQNGTESNLSNVSISILTSLGTTITATTNNLGNWSAIVPTGNTTITINTSSTAIPSGSVLTEGTNPKTVTVQLNNTNSSGNFGFFNKGTLKGHLYADINNNGIQNTLEPNLPNITVKITESNGSIQNVTTDANGNWSAIVLSGSTTSTIDTNDVDFPLNATQTQGTNPTITLVVSNTVTQTENCGFNFLIDSDGDGILDDTETANGTDPQDPCNPSRNVGYIGFEPANLIWQAGDCDGDGILNGLEYTNATDPYNPCSPAPAATNTTFVSTNTIWKAADCDNDGLTNGQEITLGTYPFVADTDGDGIKDGPEVTNNTNPKLPCDPVQPAGYTNYVSTNTIWQAGDCDGDGILNGLEYTNATDPYNPCSPTPAATNTTFSSANPIWKAADCDNDGLTNGQEITLGTSPFVADTDGDGIKDGPEVTNNTNPKLPCDPVQPAGYTNYVSTNTIWQAGDCDGDGILNGLEYTNATDPYNPCSPTPAATNITFSSANPIWKAADCDNDGLTNGQEITLGTYPFIADTDGDGIKDGPEVTNNTNPKLPCDPVQQIGYSGYVATNTIWQAGDCDGDGILNGEEHTDNTIPYDPCDPEQIVGYTGYDTSNPMWQNADCDGDGTDNFDEDETGTDPYSGEDNGIKIFNAISPNGDSKNETFYIVGINLFTNNKLTIFNRWGVEVYYKENYNNQFNGISEGRATIKEGEKLPSGTYFYTFEFTKSNAQGRKIVGYLYIN